MAQIQSFGAEPDGGRVDQITLNGGGLTAHILTYGAILRDLRLAGHDAPLVLGFEMLQPYLDHGGYFGATVGRCANRIAGGAFTLDGMAHQLDRNDGENHLHGGQRGLSKSLWTVTDAGAGHVTLGLVSPAGEMGYPGTLTLALTITLLPRGVHSGVLDLMMTATTDAPTLCNPAHHSYFNLGAPDILSHSLQIEAPHYLPTTAEHLPTGQLAPCMGAFNFTHPRHLADACASAAIDHNFCLSHAPQPLRRVATLAHKGLKMQVSTDQPGLQIYDAARMQVPTLGLEGRTYGPYGGLAMEPQFWPDAINHPDWAQPVLRPGQTYRQHTQFAFSQTQGAP